MVQQLLNVKTNNNYLRSRLGKKQNKTFMIFSKLYVVIQLTSLRFHKRNFLFQCGKRIKYKQSFFIYYRLCQIKSYVISHTMYLPTLLHERVSCGSRCLPKQERFFFCSVVFCCLYEITLTLTYNSWNEVIIVMFTCFCRKTNINFFSWCLNVFLKNENVTEEFQCHHEQCQCTNERFYKTQDCFAWTK